MGLKADLRENATDKVPFTHSMHTCDTNSMHNPSRAISQDDLVSKEEAEKMGKVDMTLFLLHARLNPTLTHATLTGATRATLTRNTCNMSPLVGAGGCEIHGMLCSHARGAPLSIYLSFCVPSSQIQK